MSQFNKFVGTLSGMFAMLHAHEKVVGHVVNSDEAIASMERHFEKEEQAKEQGKRVGHV